MRLLGSIAAACLLMGCAPAAAPSTAQDTREIFASEEDYDWYVMALHLNFKTLLLS